MQEIIVTKNSGSDGDLAFAVEQWKIRNSQELGAAQIAAQRGDKNLSSPPAAPRGADRPKQSTADSILLQLDAMEAIPGSNHSNYSNQLPASRLAHGNEYGAAARRRNDSNSHGASSYTLLLP